MAPASGTSGIVTVLLRRLRPMGIFTIPADAANKVPPDFVFEFYGFLLGYELRHLNISPSPKIRFWGRHLFNTKTMFL